MTGDGPASTSTSPSSRRALRELWLDIEPFLTQDERASLGSSTFDRVFPEREQPRPDATVAVVTG